MPNRTVLIVFLLSSAGLCEAQTDLTKCIKVDQVMKFLALYRTSKPTYPQSQLVAAIKEKGFCARPTDAEWTRIREAEASHELVAAIEEATRRPGDVGPRPNPIKPPPPPKEGT